MNISREVLPSGTVMELFHTIPTTLYFISTVLKVMSIHQKMKGSRHQLIKQYIQDSLTSAAGIKQHQKPTSLNTVTLTSLFSMVLVSAAG